MDGDGSRGPPVRPIRPCWFVSCVSVISRVAVGQAGSIGAGGLRLAGGEWTTSAAPAPGNAAGFVTLTRSRAPTPTPALRSAAGTTRSASRAMHHSSRSLEHDRRPVRARAGKRAPGTLLHTLGRILRPVGQPAQRPGDYEDRNLYQQGSVSLLTARRRSAEYGSHLC